jgi:hypothetical protein
MKLSIRKQPCCLISERRFGAHSSLPFKGRVRVGMVFDDEPTNMALQNRTPRRSYTNL